jgi:hypothetical protein
METRKSHTGWLLFWGGALIAWQSRRQGGVAQSSSEAEFTACCALANEVSWWKRFLEELGYDDQSPTVLLCDNSSAVTLADHAGSFERTKHWPVRIMALREYQAIGMVVLQWVATARQLADCMTKALPPIKFLPNVSMVMGAGV